MNTSDLLSAEERELARLLGRPGSAAGPSAQLDAQILAMARNAPAAAPTEAVPTPAPVATALPPRPAATGGRRRRRVFSSLAAVASLVMVVGLAWQLRPLPPQPGMPLPAAAEISAAPAALPNDSGAAAMAAADSNANSAPSVAADKVAEIAPAPATARVRAHPAPAPTAAPVADAAPAPEAFRAATVVAPAPPAPPAPAAATALSEQIEPASAPVQAVSPAFAPTQDQSTSARSLPSRPAPIPHAGPKAMAKVAEARREQAQAANIGSDASLPRQQWIKRIRERRDGGDLEGARASIHQFVLDYPEARIPRDLRPLLEP